MTLDEKFKALEADNAPGQEVWQDIDDLNTIMRGGKFDGVPVDFSHGDVDAFPPTPGSSEAWKGGFERGGQQAYKEYRGAAQIREGLADRLGKFTGKPVSADSELIITPGTHGALFSLTHLISWLPSLMFFLFALASLTSLPIDLLPSSIPLFYSWIV